MATSEISSVIIRNREKGAVQGFGIGALAAGALGVTLPFWAPDTDCGSWNDETVLGKCGGWALAFGAAGVLTGSFTGLFVGRAIASKQTYVFRPETSSSHDE
jgi:hypothetical protein